MMHRRVALRMMVTGGVLTLGGVLATTQAATHTAAPAAGAANGSGTSSATEAALARVRRVVPQATLLGEGRLRYFGFHVYDARLWGAPDFDPERYASQPFALELTYARTFSGQDIAARSLKEMQRGGPIDEAQGEHWLQQMTQAFPDVVSGDRLLGIHEPQAGARFLYNEGQERRIDDGEFARLFFGIWLAPWTSDGRLRDALLSNRLAGSVAPR